MLNLLVQMVKLVKVLVLPHASCTMDDLVERLAGSVLHLRTPTPPKAPERKIRLLVAVNSDLR